MTPEQLKLMARARRRRAEGEGGQQSLQQRPIPWSDVATGAVKNLPRSALQLGKDIVHPVMHPIDTAKSLYGMASGGVQKLIPGEQENEAQWDAVTKFFKDRYVGPENLKRTLMEDPAGLVADLSTVLSGGGTLAARLPGMAGRAGKATARLGSAIDPASAAVRGVAPVVAKVAPLVGSGIASTVGNLGTGTGAESIRQAYQSGREGGAKAEHFTSAMRGLEDAEVIASEARDALARMRQTRSRKYVEGSKEWLADKTRLDFTPVNDKLVEMVDSVLEGDHWTIGKESQRTLNDIAKVVNEWRFDKKMHTAGGLDSLKRRIDDMMPNKLDAGQSGRLVTQMRNTVKDIIVEQVPEYRNVMKEYEVAIKLED